MRIVDANVLLHAVNTSSPVHSVARGWLDDALGSTETVGLPWVALLAFLRLSTKEPVFPAPLSIGQSLDVVRGWLAAPNAQATHPGPRHSEILDILLRQSGTGGNLTTDAHLAAIAIEHSAELWSFDRDFARFTGLAFRQLGS